MRRRTMSSRPAGKAKKRVAEYQATAASPKRVLPPLVEQFHVAVDRQLKSGHGTYQEAEIAAREIKKRYPLLQVTVYDAKEQRHVAIEGPKTAADPRKNSSHRESSMMFQRRDAAPGVH
jgi:hypothetical protein